MMAAFVFSSDMTVIELRKLSLCGVFRDWMQNTGVMEPAVVMAQHLLFSLHTHPSPGPFILGPQSPLRAHSLGHVCFVLTILLPPPQVI